VAIGIDKAVVIHEAVVLRLFHRRATSSDGFAHEIIHLSAAFAAQAMEDFNGLRRIADVLGRELTELRMREHHDVDVLADNDARSGTVRELWVMRIAQRLKKSHRLGQVFDRKIDEYFGVHFFIFSLVLVRYENATFKDMTNEWSARGHWS
jgi:hypothetical protein